VRSGYRRHLKRSCARCGFAPEHPSQLEIHHLDRNRLNNDPSNLETFCANCHALLHRTTASPRGKRRPRRGDTRVPTRITVDLAVAERYAERFKALADPTRLAIVASLSRVGELCVQDLNAAFELSQPTMSHHLGLLRKAGLVEARRFGTLSYYRVAPEILEELQSALVDACLAI
jgi:ArsR family transcriptional regulator